LKDDKGVVCILKDRARKGRVEGVSDIPGIGSGEDQALEGVGQEDEKVGGERVPLAEAEAPAALNPTARLAVEEDRGVDSRGEVRIQLRQREGNPLASSMRSKASQLTESNVFRKSSFRIMAGSSFCDKFR
jgi:hypothetical protein